YHAPRYLPSFPTRRSSDLKQLQKFYQSLSPSTRADMSRFVAASKQSATRVRRAERMAERLMETMEAERELPPLMRQAFVQNAGRSEEHTSELQSQSNLVCR